MKNALRNIILFSIWFASNSCSQKTNIVWLDDLPMEEYNDGIRPIKTKMNYKNDTISMDGVNYERGIGSITTNVISFYLDGNAKRFSASVGMDDAVTNDIAVKFYVVADGKVLFESGEMKVGDSPREFDVDLKGIDRLGLLVTDDIGGVGNKGTYVNWGDARLEMIGDGLPKVIPNNSERYILTPKPKEGPRINSAKVFGATPGNPFLFTLATTGKRPIQFSADNLPEGLILDSKTGIITGRVMQKGTYIVKLKAENKFGVANKELKIVIGDKIALTPPIGWNGWNSWAFDIDREKVIASANAMVSNGLRDHGWTYINIDDTWQGVRGGQLNALQPNEKFPKFKEMVDYIHSLGLKAGIYSTPYVYSYAGYPGASSDFENGGEMYEPVKARRKNSTLIGKYRFETNDALQMAEWGFDYLKYDWRIDVNSTERMAKALKKSGRDIIFSISNSAPFRNVEDWVGLTNLWRTGPDIRDSWNCLYLKAFEMEKWAPYAGPGHWNDTDMMILGNVAMGPTKMHPSRLTPDEQYTHVSIFSLLASPLLIGCPIEQLDDFTLGLLTNDEVIEVNQDPLGIAGRLRLEEDGVQVYVKPMEDGSFAVGLFNISDFGKTPESYFRWGDETAKTFTFDFEKAGLQGKWRLRDLWRQKDLGLFERSLKTEIRHHGVVMLRMFPNKM
ncbi:MAG TPA: NPCBM/NEW2 domain-containing protein [Arenibacter sp.]|nr:NPCBM/NEW2 domain-containing protein [Arenibacter sp.]